MATRSWESLGWDIGRAIDAVNDYRNAENFSAAFGFLAQAFSYPD